MDGIMHIPFRFVLVRFFPNPNSKRMKRIGWKKLGRLRPSNWLRSWANWLPMPPTTTARDRCPRTWSCKMELRFFFLGFFFPRVRSGEMFNSFDAGGQLPGAFPVHAPCLCFLVTFESSVFLPRTLLPPSCMLSLLCPLQLHSTFHKSFLFRPNLPYRRTPSSSRI